MQTGDELKRNRKTQKCIFSFTGGQPFIIQRFSVFCIARKQVMIWKRNDVVCWLLLAVLPVFVLRQTKT